MLQAGIVALCALPAIAEEGGTAALEREARSRCISFAQTLKNPNDPQYPGSTAELTAYLDKAVPHCQQAWTNKAQDPLGAVSVATVLAFAGDYTTARAAAEHAIAQGNGDAIGLRAGLRAKGLGERADPAGAVAGLREAEYRHADAIAAWNLGVMHAHGIGVARDPIEAFRFHLSAARRKDLAGMLRVAQDYNDGFGVTADRAQAEIWWRRAAESLAVEAQPHPARLENRGPPPSLDWIRGRAEAGEPWAQTFIGKLHERGYLLPQSASLAMQWYRRAADQLYVPAEGAIGYLYQAGRGVPIDLEEARRWYYRYMARDCGRETAPKSGIGACDALASDPYDRHSIAPGVSSRCLAFVAEQAVAACRKAVATSPENVRLRAQLARSLAHAGDLNAARAEAERAAARGSASAMVLLGVMYDGWMEPRDPVKARDWYRRAATADGNVQTLQFALRAETLAGNQPAVQALRERLAQRSSAPAAPLSRHEQLRRKAAAGDAEAQYDLATSLDLGNGVARDPAEAIRWYREAAAKGHGGAEQALAEAYLRGRGVERNPAEAERLLREGARRGAREARWELALLLRDREAYREAREWLDRLVTDGDVRAMTEIGEWYENGRGMPADPRAAAQWYARAEKSSEWARFKLAMFYTQGIGIARDEAEARRRWQGLAEAGDARAQNNLAVMLERGLGGPRDLDRARERYIAAARMGSAHAIGNLEAIYDKGSAPREPAAAIAWYRPGAEVGVPSAQYRLAELLLAPGQNLNEEQGLQWLRRAAENGDARATRRLTEIESRRLQAKGAPREWVDAFHAAAEKQQREPVRMLPAGFAFDEKSDQGRTMRVRAAPGGGSIAAVGADTSWQAVLSKPLFTPRKTAKSATQ